MSHKGKSLAHFLRASQGGMMLGLCWWLKSSLSGDLGGKPNKFLMRAFTHLDEDMRETAYCLANVFWDFCQISRGCLCLSVSHLWRREQRNLHTLLLLTHMARGCKSGCLLLCSIDACSKKPDGLHTHHGLSWGSHHHQSYWCF